MAIIAVIAIMAMMGCGADRRPGVKLRKAAGAVAPRRAAGAGRYGQGSLSQVMVRVVILPAAMMSFSLEPLLKASMRE